MLEGEGGGIIAIEYWKGREGDNRYRVLEGEGGEG